MTYTPRLVAAGLRHHTRAADAAEADTTPGHSLGMPVVTTIPAEYADLAYCRGCGDLADADDGSCGCDVEATDTGPDPSAVEARLESLGIPVMSLDEWAAESCPSLAAEAAEVRATTT